MAGLMHFSRGSPGVLFLMNLLDIHELGAKRNRGPLAHHNHMCVKNIGSYS
jgi:hypothetical protein